MNDPSCPIPQDEPKRVDRLVDQLCDDFESHWRSGSSPQIEEYLSRVPSSNHRDLLSQLIGIELHWRKQRDDDPDAQEYYRRFPQDVDLVDHGFRASDGLTAPPNGTTSAIQGAEASRRHGSQG